MEVGALNLLCISLLIIQVLIAKCADVQCDPAEIGTNHSISCISTEVNNYISWFRVLNQEDKQLFQCLRNNSCYPFTLSFLNVFNATMEPLIQGYKSTLVIYNIRPNNASTFKCSTDLSQHVDVCNPMEFFSKPRGVQCNDQLKINKNNEISIHCFVTNVYPTAKMLLNASDFITTTNCENDTSLTPSIVTCQNNISVKGMKEGILFIDVLIFPSVKNGEQFGVKIQLNISLSLPISSLGQDCLSILTTTQGYIQQGTPANCTCYVKTQGVPPGGVKWFYNNGTEVGSGSSSESAILQVMLDKKETNQSYSCFGVSALEKDNQRIEFTVRNAYGPEQVSIFTKKFMHDICLPDEVINIICSILKDNVAPEPIVKISVLDGESLTINPNQNLTHYTYISLYSPKSAGYLSLRCEANNSIFNKVKTSADTIVYISKPPTKPPLLKIGQQSYSGNNFKTAESQKEGSDIEITCQVFGGFPNAYNMTLSCDDSYNNLTTNSDVVSLSIKKVGRQLNGKQCVCKAEHVTSCYVYNTSSVTLNITFSAAVHQFTANSNSSSLTVSNNSDVIFVCDTESNPPATVQIFKTETLMANTDKVNFTELLTCEDSGEYFCKAHNSEYAQTNLSSLILYVLCSLQLTNANENNRVFPKRKGDNAVIKFNVLGFPTPVSYSLIKKLEYEYVLPNFSSDGLGKSKYQIDYGIKSLPYGTISLTIFSLTDEDFTNYTLNVNNSIDGETRLSFAIIKDKAKDVDILPAAIGGTIGGLVFITVIIIIIIFIGEAHLQQLWKKLKSIRHHQYAEQDQQNNDIYIFNSKNGLGLEINYKNYNDVPITITSATALPKNLKLKSKSALMPTYFNSAGDYSNEFLMMEADKSYLIKKEIKNNDPAAGYSRDKSNYQNDVYANS